MDQHIYDLIIIGGGPAGLSAGVYAGRAMLDTAIVEKGAHGGQAATTSEIANYPGIIETTGPKLIEDMKTQCENFGVSFISGEVEDMSLDGEVKSINVNGRPLKARAVIAATGAKPRTLGFPGEAEFTGRGVAYCATCDGSFFTDLEVFVIGAGYAAVEEAMFLTKFARKVTIVAREPEFTCAKSIAEKAEEYDNIHVEFNTEIVEASGDGMVQSATFVNNITGHRWTHTADEEDGLFGIFVFVGYKPTTGIFKGQIELDQWGYIPTDSDMRTNIKGVYAAGDLRPKSLRQVVTAVADGAIAATDAEKYVEERKSALGIKKETKKKKIEVVKKEEPKKQALESSITEQLKGIFAKLHEELTLVTIVDRDNPKSLELEGFLEEVSTLSENINLISKDKGEDISLEEKVNADKYPVVALLNSKEDYTGVKFHGVPGGHELNSFILAIYNLAGPGQEIDKVSVEKVASITERKNIKVAVSLSCHLCPDVVASAHRIAILNENIEAEMIDINDFGDIKKKHKIMSVPAIIIDDEVIHFGAKNIESIIDLIK